MQSAVDDDSYQGAPAPGENRNAMTLTTYFSRTGQGMKNIPQQAYHLKIPYSVLFMLRFGTHTPRSQKKFPQLFNHPYDTAHCAQDIYLAHFPQNCYWNRTYHVFSSKPAIKRTISKTL
jgi:hypothetical protein